MVVIDRHDPCDYEYEAKGDWSDQCFANERRGVQHHLGAAVEDASQEIAMDKRRGHLGIMFPA
jgi:hypothetical protein